MRAESEGCQEGRTTAGRGSWGWGQSAAQDFLLQGPGWAVGEGMEEMSPLLGKTLVGLGLSECQPLPSPPTPPRLPEILRFFFH